MNHDAQKLLDDYQMGIQANQLIKELTIAQQQMVEIVKQFRIIQNFSYG